MRRGQTLAVVTTVLGVISLFSLIAYFLALHDIWYDYASRHVFSHAGQPIPASFDPVNDCHLEWSVLQIGFLPLLAFHVLFLVHRVRESRRPASSANPPAEVSAASRP